VDGSLRNNGVEYVSVPLSIRETMSAFRWVCNHAAEQGLVSHVRAGIHVHADMRDLSIEQVRGVLAAYAAFEPLFFSLVPADREENIYCVPWYRATDQARIVPCIGRSLTDTEQRAAEAMVKYSALYIRPLWSYGTIEFRHAPTWLSPAPFRRWLCAISRVIEWGKNHTPQTVADECVQNPNILVKKVFGWTMAHIPDPEALMDEANSLATVDEMIPYTYKESDSTFEDGAGLTAGCGYHQQVRLHETLHHPPDDDDDDDDDRDYEEQYNEDRDDEGDEW
jgi:hypothetical protein